jgi:hypothetical protein
MFAPENSISKFNFTVFLGAEKGKTIRFPFFILFAFCL